MSDHIALWLNTFPWLPLHSKEVKAEVLKETCNDDKSSSPMPSAPFAHLLEPQGPFDASVGKLGPVSSSPESESTPPYLVLVFAQ